MTHNILTMFRKLRGSSTLAVINQPQNGSKTVKNVALNLMIFSHYQKIIVALSETYRLMKEIEGVEIE
jgi:hypothetical protein